MIIFENYLKLYFILPLNVGIASPKLGYCYYSIQIYKCYNYKNDNQVIKILIFIFNNISSPSFQRTKLLKCYSGIFYQATKFETQFSSNKLYSAYCGYDPTASSLHLGHLISIISMIRISQCGIKPIFLIGGATGMIGDPSGKSKQRNLLTEQIVNENFKGIQQDIQAIYSRIRQKMQKINQPITDFQIINNYNFYKDMNTLTFLRDIGKHFRISSLLNKQSISQRLQSDEGISYTQFSYTLMQAYDYLKLYETKNCMLQIGGSDQWGNITNGCHLVNRVKGIEVEGLTIPLLVNSKGQKFGKSEGNALFLKSTDDNIYNIHQYLYNSTDEEVESLLYRFTFYSVQQIKDIMMQHCKNPEMKLAQNTLANEVSSYLGQYHNANEQYFLLKYQEIKNKNIQFFEKLYQKIPQNLIFTVKITQIDQQEQIVSFFTKIKIAKSKNNLRRQIEGGGFYINNKRIQPNEMKLSPKQLFNIQACHGKYMLIRFGKKKYNFVRFV